MSFVKTIYPPTVANVLPAFDGDLQFYFKPSVANSFQEIKAIHFTLVRLDSNKNALSNEIYPYELIHIPVEQVYYSTEKQFYYFTIPRNTFPTIDTIYKAQIRLVQNLASNPPADLQSAQMGQWLKDNLNYFSEWSIVSTVMPITPPSFGLQGFETEEDLIIRTSGETYIGNYEPLDPQRSEVLKQYSINIYEVNNNDRKLIESSGVIKINNNLQNNISFSSIKELKNNGLYEIAFTIQTKNLYTKTKIYQATAKQEEITMFNTVSTEVSAEEGLINATVLAKQTMFKPKDETTEINYYRKSNDPNEMSPYTNAIINGSVVIDNNFYLQPINNSWVLQAQIKPTIFYSDIREGFAKPFLELSTNPIAEGKKYFTRYKLCALSVNRETDTRYPAEIYNVIVCLKEICKYDIDTKQQTVLYTQHWKHQITNTNKIYYIYLKESLQGTDFVIQ